MKILKKEKVKIAFEVSLAQIVNTENLNLCESYV